MLSSVERFFSPEGQQLLDEEISPRVCTIFDGLLRSQSNYEKLNWFTFDVTYLASLSNFCFPMTQESKICSFFLQLKRTHTLNCIPIPMIDM